MLLIVIVTLGVALVASLTLFAKEHSSNKRKQKDIDEQSSLINNLAEQFKDELNQKDAEIAILTPRLDIVNPEYLSFFFKIPFTKSLVEKHYLTGTAIKRVILKGFKVIQIPVPPLYVQQSFAQKIQSIESQKASINRSIAETQKLFDYTMDKYFG